MVEGHAAQNREIDFGVDAGDVRAAVSKVIADLLEGSADAEEMPSAGVAQGMRPAALCW